LKVPTLYDSEDYLKKLSSTNLKNSPKPKTGTSFITPPKFVSTNDLADFKKELEQTMNNKMDTIIQLLHNNPTIKQDNKPEKIEKKDDEENNET
jgi:hypothetical protein